MASSCQKKLWRGQVRAGKPNRDLKSWSDQDVWRLVLAIGRKYIRVRHKEYERNITSGNYGVSKLPRCMQVGSRNHGCLLCSTFGNNKYRRLSWKNGDSPPVSFRWNPPHKEFIFHIRITLRLGEQRRERTRAVFGPCPDVDKLGFWYQGRHRWLSHVIRRDVMGSVCGSVFDPTSSINVRDCDSFGVRFSTTLPVMMITKRSSSSNATPYFDVNSVELAWSHSALQKCQDNPH